MISKSKIPSSDRDPSDLTVGQLVRTIGTKYAERTHSTDVWAPVLPLAEIHPDELGLILETQPSSWGTLLHRVLFSRSGAVWLSDAALRPAEPAGSFRRRW